MAFKEYQVARGSGKTRAAFARAAATAEPRLAGRASAAPLAPLCRPGFLLPVRCTANVLRRARIRKGPSLIRACFVLRRYFCERPRRRRCGHEGKEKIRSTAAASSSCLLSRLLSPLLFSLLSHSCLRPTYLSLQLEVYTYILSNCISSLYVYIHRYRCLIPHIRVLLPPPFFFSYFLFPANRPLHRCRRSERRPARPHQ